MTIANGYCTLAEFKAFKDIGSTDTGDDAVIESIVEAVSRYIDKETNLFFYDDQAAVRCYSPEMGDMLQLDAPLYGVDSLKTDDDGDGTYENTWATTDYHLMPLNGDTKHWIRTNQNGDYAFPVGVLAGVEITGDWGYAAVPADINLVCMNIVKNVNGRREGQGDEAVQITAAGVVITPKDISPYDRKVLNQYRRPR